MADFYTARFEGGPMEGNRAFPKSFMSWPLPDVIPAPSGEYRKVSESDLPASVDDSPHVSRGANYEWVAKAREPKLTTEEVVL